MTTSDATAAWPLPGDLAPDAADQPFWDACRERTLLIQRCDQCHRYGWPAGACPEHGLEPMRWVPAAGTATLHTWTVIHQRYPNAFEDGPATNVAVVQLDEGPFLHTKIVGCDNRDLRLGMPVEVTYREVRADLTLPLFTPRAPSGAG
jgi:uncharacterized OB-fold protein